MQTKEIVLTNQGGLHARPATFFVQECNKYKSTVTVTCNGKSGNAKSVITLMSLGAGEGKTITLTIEGEDEVVAMENLIQYLEQLT